MELELSLGDSIAPAKDTFTPVLGPTYASEGEGHELVLELGVGSAQRAEQDNQKTPMQPEEDDEARCHSESPVELSLGCPLLPASAETGSVNSEVCVWGFDVNSVPVDGDMAEVRSWSTSSLQVEVPVRQAADQEAAEGDENGGVGGGARKKLRLSKEQSAFLEDNFKEHSTLTPKQKSDLAKRLKLRPRQVEVWFQNRRARTKLKQTEVDCEYLKRCCETLAQENRRLQREVAELRAFRSTYPFYSHLPGFSTAALMCPSCDHNKVTAHSPVLTAVSSPVVVAPPSSMSTLFTRPNFGPFTIHPVLRRQPSATLR
ncbi:homeobox-leucine zipper protein HOX7-like [Phragmites australis]|uniref:homeobox-leucine zipper protein HOX7-like n=1 Tax=Phragmites australis TaxID=29695 RepID=UPI002D784914|nr:homeobox-leucine zipper protein HOX7-like [Phragmites australis]